MKRDLKKHIAEYRRKFLDKQSRTTRGQFYYTDFQQINEITGHGENRDYLLVWNALQAGFMIGYKAAKNEARRAAI